MTVTDDPADDAARVDVLLQNHRAFLGFLERRVGDCALLRTSCRTPSRRNAVIDQFRRRGAANRAIDAFARELDAHMRPQADVEAEICACVTATRFRRPQVLRREHGAGR